MSTPLYEQVEVELRKMIRQPEYQAGKKLPDEISLAETFGVSRSTIREAMSKLLRDHLIIRRPRTGTFVRLTATSSDIGAWSSFTHEMRQVGIEVTTFGYKAERICPTEEETLKLGLHPDSQALMVDRIRGWNDRPVARFRSLLHPRTLVTESDDFTRPLYELIRERSGLMADFARERLTAVAANETLAEVLNIPLNQPLLLRERLVTDEAYRPIELSSVWYRSDLFPLTLDQRRES